MCGFAWRFLTCAFAILPCRLLCIHTPKVSLTSLTSLDIKKKIKRRDAQAIKHFRKNINFKNIQAGEGFREMFSLWDMYMYILVGAQFWNWWSPWSHGEVSRDFWKPSSCLYRSSFIRSYHKNKKKNQLQRKTLKRQSRLKLLSFLAHNLFLNSK